MDKEQAIISRHSLLWLLIVNLSVLLPLYDKMTPWSMAICGICLLWRVGIFAGKVATPPRYLVTMLAIGSAVTLGLVTTQIGMLNGLINLLILGYALKYIEMRNRRDVRAVVIVGFFVIAITFIEKQSLWFTLQLTLVATVNLCVLVSLYNSDSKLSDTARLGGKLMLQSLPLALLLFVVLPRLPPLWLVPKANNSQTGLSNEVSFGDISQLTKSAALAFRASFDKRRPSNNRLYWRALVMEDYDGKRWTQSTTIKQIERQKQRGNYRQPPQGESINYDIISEPSHQHWLFGLDLAYSNAKEVVNLPDGRLYSTKRLDQKFQYAVSSYPDAMLDRTLSDTAQKRNLQLPEGSNPKTTQLALTFQRQYPKARERLNAMMSYFNTAPYFYTLSPPAVGPQQLDDFLFENKAGFCVHYASAFTFMARRSGLPARLVTGYQGGEWNQSGNYLSVYQYMAHAWVEVWLEDQGWVRFDPTAMIAPDRIDNGFDAFFNPAQSYLLDSPFSSLRFRQYPLLNNLRLSLASIDYYWSKWVLGFDNDKQEQLLKQLLGDISPAKLAIFIICAMGVIGLAIAYSVGLLQFNRQQDSIVAGFEQISTMLAQKGLVRAVNESPQAYCQRVLEAYPQLQLPLTQFVDCYISLKYKPLSPRNQRALTRHFKKRRTQLRIAILKVNGQAKMY
jgi:transglutaminase-like putative cysteine protease